MKTQKTSLWKSDLCRIFSSWKIYVSFGLGLLLVLRPLFAEGVGAWPYYSPMELLSIPLGISDFTPFAAIFCVLPFAESFCEDYNSNYINNLLIRVGPRKYSRQRCLSVALTGGVVMGAIMLITILLCTFAAGQPETEESVSFLSSTIWAKMGVVLPWKGAIMYALRVLLAFLFGALWALAGLAVSSVITNRYVTLIAPFVIYQVLWYLLAEAAVNPVYLLRGDSSFIPSFGFALTYQLACIAACGIISYFGIRRKASI